MARFPKPGEGSWTQHYPRLGTAPVSYMDSASPAWFELEKEAIFRRAWLHVGRVEQLPLAGSYFTRELLAAGTSIIVARGTDGELRAFHNVCRHRGNRLVWSDFPRQETSGVSRQFACKYHGWRYGLDGACTFVQQQDEFFDLDRADYGLVPLHCDTFAGFIFVNVAPEPQQSLAEFLGPMVGNIEGYPFADMTDQYVFNVDCRANWKVFADSLLEFYHAPVLHLRQHPGALHARISETGFEAPHYQLDGPHGLLTTAGSIHRGWEMPPELVKPADWVTQSGLFGPWEGSDLGPLPTGINPGGVEPWGMTALAIFPNVEIAVWQSGWYSCYEFWPTGHDSVHFQARLCWLPARNARERIGREMAAVAFKEYAIQDANTLEATQMALSAEVVNRFPLNDQEVLIRHFHRAVAEHVAGFSAANQ